ncbi:MAG: hypothetical protein ABIU58_09595 [Ramlibacter sp.]
MIATARRRRLIVFLLVGLALLGGAIRQGAANPSLARDIGTLMLVLWLPVIGNVVAFVIRSVRERTRRVTAFDPQLPFTAHLWVELGPADPESLVAGRHPPGDSSCTLVTGTEGFTARLPVPLAQWLAQGQAQPVALELLRPALAVPRMTPATAFRVLARGQFVGEGKVLGASPPGK